MPFEPTEAWLAQFTSPREIDPIIQALHGRQRALEQQRMPAYGWEPGMIVRTLAVHRPGLGDEQPFGSVGEIIAVEHRGDSVVVVPRALHHVCLVRFADESTALYADTELEGPLIEGPWGPSAYETATKAARSRKSKKA